MHWCIVSTDNKNINNNNNHPKNCLQQPGSYKGEIMPSCQVCNLNETSRLCLDRELVQGKGYTKLAKKYGVEMHAVRNHAMNHLSYQLKNAYEAKTATENMNLLNEIEELIHETKDIFRQAKSESKLNVALNAIGQARGSYELLSKIAFSLHQARLTELEIERMQNSQEEDVDQQLYQECLSCLSDDELRQYERITKKMRDHARNIDKLPDDADWKEPAWMRNDDDEEDDIPRRTKSRSSKKIEETLTPQPEPEEFEPGEQELEPQSTDFNAEAPMRRTNPPKSKSKMKPGPIEPTKLEYDSRELKRQARNAMTNPHR